MICAFCKEEIKIDPPISRSDTCPRCGRDIRCCKNCAFYDPSAYNECREVMAERIVEKERSNFCDYFRPKGDSSAQPGENDKVKDAKAKLEALFKKKQE